ncbi:hypothetical protein BGX29_001432 [Mortierella sp. GBA35]|nr:hypothetical protein BGX29_001432 [Mortierella sp. GBA35]
MNPQQLPLASAGRLPTELVVAFGLFLDGPSLLASLQVCQQWHHSLIPLVWRSINKSQWLHPRFPIRHSTFQQDLKTLPPALLLHIRELEFGSIFKDELVRQAELHTVFLTRVLESTPNLASLSLSLEDDYHPHPTLIQALLQLKRLKRLSFDAVSLPGAISIEELLPLVSRLDQLVLPSAMLIKRKGQDETGPPTTSPPWTLKRLELSRGSLPLLEHCSDLTLTELIIRRGFSIQVPISAPYSLLPIVRFSGLQSLRLGIENAFSESEDAVLILSSLRHIRRLVLDVFDVDHLSILTLPPSVAVSARQRPLVPTIEQNGDDHRTTILPLLEDLAVHFVRAPFVSTRVSVFRHLLMTRQRLKSFAVTNFEMDPDLLFAPPRGGSERDGWVCKGLESLTISLSKDTFYKTDDRRDYTWRNVYGQIGKLDQLRSLSVRCYGLQRTVEAGLEQLAGATRLQDLTLVDTRHLRWSRAEFEDLLPLVPSLKTFNMGPLRDSNYQAFLGWLEESEHDVRLIR